MKRLIAFVAVMVAALIWFSGEPSNEDDDNAAIIAATAAVICATN